MIIFRIDNSGKVKLFPYGITNGINTIGCDTEKYAQKLVNNIRYIDYTIINSDEPSEDLIEMLKGVRFDTVEDAEKFINGGGYTESMAARVADLELIMAEMIGGDF